MAVELTDTLASIGQREPGTILDLLSRRFRPELIQQRKIGGRQVGYVPVHAVIERLNRACNRWHYRIVSRDRETLVLDRWNEATRKSEPRDVPVYVVVGKLEIPELSTRQALGVQALDDRSGGGFTEGGRLGQPEEMRVPVRCPTGGVAASGVALAPVRAAFRLPRWPV